LCEIGMRVAPSPDGWRRVQDLTRGRSPLILRIEEEAPVNNATRRLGAGLILTGFAIGLTGCGEESSSRTQTEVKTPGGTATVTEKTTVDKTGKTPPPVNEPVKNP
jgi:hypothetical protein